MKKILLIGGAGYVGTVLIKKLLEANYHVKCVDNLIYEQSYCINDFLSNENFEFCNIDIRDKKKLSPHFDNVHAVISFA